MTTAVPVGRRSLDDTFARGLDRDVWLPHYLPHWAGLDASAATWGVASDGLHLVVPPDQGVWCEGRHTPPLRVSCVQSGHLDGQAPFVPGLAVHEPVAPFVGLLAGYGRVEARLRMRLTPSSMAALWLAGYEDRPERSGEVCVVEVFGDAVRPAAAGAPATAAVGAGVHRFRDPALTEDWSADRLEVDVSRWHTWAVELAPGSTTVLLDGRPFRHVPQAPDYPLQLFLGVFDFPGRGADVPGAEPGPAAGVPEMVVGHVRVEPAAGQVERARP
ncbi:glycoside hydrolase family 16 protein [Cellulomonas endophytica]|uniref:glycoside hydrolase family 16 protein n=1 Tax=Cellulomonas endophytica TaxID=2494735 RepID=UPI001011B566|nr:glycoside hydrolase family 16 protein [Cellulomonas endophytica]